MGMQLSFGSGAMWGERTDVTGSGIGPVPFGVLQSGMIDFDFTNKELRGQNQFPIAVARSAGKITGSCDYAQLLSEVSADLFFGVTPATGMLMVANGEANTVPASSPYAVTVANAANFNYDLGVIYAGGANAGQKFTRVTTPSMAGQYSVNQSTGVYTFSSADANASLAISYAYNNTTTGYKQTITNQLQGYTPTFKLTALVTYQAAQRTIELPACVASKLSFDTKIDEWDVYKLSFDSFADAAGNIAYISAVQ